MRDVWSELEEALGEETRCTRRLLELGQRKRDSLVAVDTAAVSQCVRQEQSLLLALGAAASNRMRLTSQAAGGQEASVSRLAASAGEPRATRLRVAAGELSRTIQDLRGLTQTNRVLTEESLGFVKRFFQILGSMGQGEVGYAPRSAVQRSQATRLLIDEVV